MTTHYDVLEYWDSPPLKVFHGKVTMNLSKPSVEAVKPSMSYFFYMDQHAGLAW